MGIISSWLIKATQILNILSAAHKIDWALGIHRWQIAFVELKSVQHCLDEHWLEIKTGKMIFLLSNGTAFFSVCSCAFFVNGIQCSILFLGIVPALSKLCPEISGFSGTDIRRVHIRHPKCCVWMHAPPGKLSFSREYFTCISSCFWDGMSTTCAS